MAYEKRIHTVSFHLHKTVEKCKLTHHDGKQIKQLPREVRNRLLRDTHKLLKVMDMVLKASKHQILHLHMGTLLCANYISMKFFKNECI